MSLGRSTGTRELASSSAVPILLHFDVNKTLIQSDSVQAKSIEECIREAIAELFWGFTRTEGEKSGEILGKDATVQEEATSSRKNLLVWEWAPEKPSCNPPRETRPGAPNKLVNYAEYCKQVFSDKDERKDAIRSFSRCGNEQAKEEMDKLLKKALEKIQLPPGVQESAAALEVGLKGCCYLMSPSVFHFVASLQREKRTFALLFRSFGTDHEIIKDEWNAFCDMRHPIFSELIQDIGPMNGTVPGVPDRRVHGFHTIYRDIHGPVMIMDTLTNGADNNWDKWARQKPKATEDTRGGRDYIRNVLKAKTTEGYQNIREWMTHHLREQTTASIKDDWAWWHWNDETAEHGKLLTVLAAVQEDSKQLFFDDKVEAGDAKIVDCRDFAGHPIPSTSSIDKLCTKVNPVEVLLDDHYFLRKLRGCHGDLFDTGESSVDSKRQLTEMETLWTPAEKRARAFLE
jgi:hypothetical protein